MFKSLAKETAIYGLTDFIFKFINFATFPLLAFVLSIEEFGVYSLLTTLSLLMGMAFHCGMNQALERFYLDNTLSTDKKAAVVTGGFLCLSLLALVVIGPCLWLAYHYRQSLYESHQMEWIAIAIALASSLPTQLFALACCVMRLNFSPWQFTIFNVAQNLISLFLSFYFVISLRWGVTGYIAGVTLGYLLMAPLATYLLFQRARPTFDWPIAKAMVKYGYPFIFTDLGRWIFSCMDRWMLGEMCDHREVGLFSMAFKLATVLIFLISSFSLSWGPYALKAYHQDPNHRFFFSRCYTLWLFILTFFSTGLSLFGIECLHWLTPSVYWPAATFLPLISAGLVFLGTTQVSSLGILITKKTYHISLMTWLAAALNFVLNLWWIPYWGALGSSLATLVTYIFLSSYYLLCSQKLYAIPLEYSKLLVCLGLLIGGTGLSLSFNSFPWQTWFLLPKVLFLTLTLYLAHLFEIVDFSTMGSYARRWWQRTEPRGLES
jgi:O-antigen/teichoic acid export membrane protein